MGTHQGWVKEKGQAQPDRVKRFREFLSRIGYLQPRHRVFTSGCRTRLVESLLMLEGEISTVTVICKYGTCGGAG